MAQIITQNPFSRNPHCTISVFSISAVQLFRAVATSYREALSKLG